MGRAVNGLPFCIVTVPGSHLFPDYATNRRDTFHQALE